MELLSVNLGQPRPHPSGEPGRLTGIYKEPAAELQVGPLGVAGDAVLDRRYHGGPAKALCCYSADHFAHWQQVYPEAEWSPGAFGENLTLAKVNETEVHLGDMFEIGDLVVQVSQPRGPCSTLAARHGIPEFVKVCVSAGYTGWYVRVLQPGVVRARDPIRSLGVHPLRVTIALANEVRYAKQPDRAAIEELLMVDALSDDWRRDLAEIWERAG